MSAFYPGADIDIVPLVMFPDITSWIYLDSQPRSEFGSNLYPGFERPLFLSRLDNAMNQVGFYKMVVQDDVVLYYNTNTSQSVRYEINAVFPQCLTKRHFGCDTLVLSGFDTESCHPPEGWTDTFRHVITNNHTIHHGSPPKNKLISSLIHDHNEWEYWLDHNLTREKIMAHVSVKECRNVGRRSERLLAKLWH